MSAAGVLAIIAGYYLLLTLVARLTSGSKDNNAFFQGNRQSPWWAVCFGMVGASISGVSFVSVPGMVSTSAMTYLQMCLGFVFGYILVACILLPLYYRLGLITIYTYLKQRFGMHSYRTGALFFFLSKLAGASIRLYLVCMILQQFVFDELGLPFTVSVAAVVLLIWFYTRQSGIRTIVWSDCLQTTVLLAALGMIIWQVCSGLMLSFQDIPATIAASPMSRIFDFDGFVRPTNFFKQFVSGIFVVVVMTGLDQDMMQKNLTCRTLRQSQLNMCVNGLLYFPINLLLLSLGVLLYMYSEQIGMQLPSSGDKLLPLLCGEGHLGYAAMVCFTIGITAAAFSSADSAMTSLTTCFCVDIMQREKDERLRKLVHPMVAAAMIGVIVLVGTVQQASIISVVYMVCGYTYGPLLGLFAFGMTTRRKPREWMVPFICLASPLCCYLADTLAQSMWQYKFGYELLLMNGALTYVLLLLSSAKLGTDDSRGNADVQALGRD